MYTSTLKPVFLMLGMLVIQGCQDAAYPQSQTHRAGNVRSSSSSTVDLSDLPASIQRAIAPVVTECNRKSRERSFNKESLQCECYEPSSIFIRGSGGQSICVQPALNAALNANSTDETQLNFQLPHGSRELTISLNEDEVSQGHTLVPDFYYQLQSAQRFRYPIFPSYYSGVDKTGQINWNVGAGRIRQLPPADQVGDTSGLHTIMSSLTVRAYRSPFEIGFHDQVFDGAFFLEPDREYLIQALGFSGQLPSDHAFFKMGDPTQLTPMELRGSTIDPETQKTYLPEEYYGHVSTFASRGKRRRPMSYEFHTANLQKLHSAYQQFREEIASGFPGSLIPVEAEMMSSSLGCMDTCLIAYQSGRGQSSFQFIRKFIRGALAQEFLLVADPINLNPYGVVVLNPGRGISYILDPKTHIDPEAGKWTTGVFLLDRYLQDTRRVELRTHIELDEIADYRENADQQNLNEPSDTFAKVLVCENVNPEMPDFKNTELSQKIFFGKYLPEVSHEDPTYESTASVTGSLNGWFRNPQGSWRQFTSGFASASPTLNIPVTTDTVHGNQVAEIITRTNDRLIYTPMSVDDCSESFEEWKQPMKESGVKVINFSARFDTRDSTLCTETFGNRFNDSQSDFLWVIGAGNWKHDRPSFACPQNIAGGASSLIVASANRAWNQIDQSTLISDFSNRGVNYADVAAHGATMFAVDQPEHQALPTQWGTSFAAPRVSAWVAMLAAEFPDFHVSEIRAAVLLAAELPYRSRGSRLSLSAPHRYRWYRDSESNDWKVSETKVDFDVLPVRSGGIFHYSGTRRLLEAWRDQEIHFVPGLSVQGAKISKAEAQAALNFLFCAKDQTSSCSESESKMTQLRAGQAIKE